MGKDFKDETSMKYRRSGVQCLDLESNGLEVDSDEDDDVFSDEEVLSTHSSVAERLGILHAVYQNDIRAFRDFLDSGVDPNICDCDGNPLLHIVIENGNNEIMEYLLREGKQEQ
jgi:ankyrin repeat protein